MQNIDLNLLRTLHALLTSGSVTGAAQRLRISQPAASRALSQLRAILGDPLLIKTNSGMALTKRAEALRQPVEEWYAATRILLRDTDSSDPADFSGRIVIASTDFGVLSVIAPAMAAIARGAPQLQLAVVPLEADSAAQLAKGTADIVITGFDPEDHRVSSRALFIETYGCIMRPAHPLAPIAQECGVLPLEELACWPHIVANVHGNDVDKIGEALAEHGLARQAVLRVPYFSVIPHLVVQSDALAVVPSRAANAFVQGHGLVSALFPAELGSFNYWLSWHERSRRDPVIQWLLEQFTVGTSDTGLLSEPVSA